jgi:anaerobic magnesium-protoporphyrin IX monomethyl ester cyclase
MDILLSHGYFLYEDEHERAIMRPYPPLGILYISSHLKSRGFDVALFDSTFHSREAFRAYIARVRPPVVGLYGNLMTRRNLLGLIRSCRDSGAIVVVGGPDPANYPEKFLDHGAHIVVFGEGEQTLEALLPHLSRYGPRAMEDIDGIAYREADGRYIRTAPRAQIPDLDLQPFPDRAAIDLHEYVRVWREHHGMGAVSLITARGCPYRCNWCSHAVYGFTHRRRSPRNVADEVESIMSTYRPDMLWYADDVFTIHHRWLHNYAAELERRGLRVPFETISREDRLNEEVVKTLARMGCFRLWIGAESGSQRILDSMERRTSAARVQEMVRLLQAHGIQAGMFIMLGYEGEKTIDLQETVDTLKGANPDIFLTTVAYPIKGTRYYEKVADRVVPLKSWEEGSDRDHTVAGRHSRRFYDFATRWMVGEVNAHKQRCAPRPDYVRMARSLASAGIGRLGMLLTQHEVEQGAARE